MPIFVVTYAYGRDTARLTQLRPEHRAWLSAQPTLLVSGPTDADGAVLIFSGESAQAVETLLDADPLAVHGGVIEERTVVGWTPVSGSVASSFPSS